MNLKALVCKEQITLERARRAMAGVWIAAFKSHVNIRDAGIELLQPVEQWSRRVLYPDINGRCEGALQPNLHFFVA
jgi:hypothetical protein